MWLPFFKFVAYQVSIEVPKEIVHTLFDESFRQLIDLKHKMGASLHFVHHHIVSRESKISGYEVTPAAPTKDLLLMSGTVIRC